jgi:predicted dehydrogenase
MTLGTGSDPPRGPARVAIIGAGNIAAAHAHGYRLAGAEIAALCDIDPELVARRRDEWHAGAAFTDPRALLEVADITAVSICTPNAAHAELTIAAARAGKHVLCEKPISLDLDAAQAMIDACADAGVLLQIGHHMRSWSAATTAHALIDAGVIGEVTHARFRQAHDWSGATRVRGVFGSKEHSGGGTLLDNGCHLFDLARFLCGDVSDVFARIATRKFDVEVEDTAVTSLGFTSGAMGEVEVAWTATGWQEAFWVWGTQGALECDHLAGTGDLIRRYRSDANTSWAAVDVENYEAKGPGAHAQHVANFLAAIDGRGPVVCTGEDGREAVRLVLAAYESARCRAPVSLHA